MCDFKHYCSNSLWFDSRLTKNPQERKDEDPASRKLSRTSVFQQQSSAYKVDLPWILTRTTSMPGVLLLLWHFQPLRLFFFLKGVLLLAALTFVVSARGERAFHLQIVVPDVLQDLLEVEAEPDEVQVWFKSSPDSAKCEVSETEIEELRWTGDLSTVNRNDAEDLSAVTLPKTLHIFANDCLASKMPEFVRFFQDHPRWGGWSGEFTFSFSCPRDAGAGGAVELDCKIDNALVWDLLFMEVEQEQGPAQHQQRPPLVLEALIRDQVDGENSYSWRAREYFHQWHSWAVVRNERVKKLIEEHLETAARSSLPIEVRLEALHHLARLERLLTELVDGRISRAAMALVNIPKGGEHYQWYVDMSPRVKARVVASRGGSDAVGMVPADVPVDWGEGDLDGLDLLRHLQAFLWKRFLNEFPSSNPKTTVIVADGENIWTLALAFLRSS